MLFNQRIRDWRLLRAERLLSTAPRRALALFVAAAVDDAEAAFRAGTCYAEGNGAPVHLFEAARWFRLAAEAGHERAQFRLAELHLAGVPEQATLFPSNGLFETGVTGEADYHASLPWARRAAESGAADAQALLGFIFSSGPPGLRDAGTGLDWYRRSAEQDFPAGCLGYGITLLAQADGGADNTKIACARRQMLRAAEAGLPTAHYMLGIIAEMGVGTARDEAEARASYHVAAVAGQSKAQARLGAMLLEGRGGPADRLNGETWLRRAVLGGAPEAALRLGAIYIQDHNGVEAVRWYELAAQAGEAQAQAALAGLYLSGQGVVRDHQTAKFWLLRAAEAEHPGAMYGLGVLHAGGYDIVPDAAQARHWLAEAANRDHPLAALVLARFFLHGVGGAVDVAAARRSYARAIQLGASGAAAELARCLQAK
jgi:TPR repeat protein